MGSMLSPVGNVAEKVRASPAAGAAKWLETLSRRPGLHCRLVRDGGRGRPAVADGKMEALADRLTMGVGRRDVTGLLP